MRNVARILSAIAVAVFAAAADAQTIRTVTNTNDTGIGSLRDAIATCSPVPCEVRFDPTAFPSPSTIGLLSGLTVPNQVTIDGFTGIGSPNTAAFPAPDNAVRKVTIDGLACSTCTAFTFPAGNTQPAAVKGLIIANFPTAIFIQGSQARVTGNWIRDNSSGVVISGATSTQLNYIGGPAAADRNIIGGNLSGIQVTGSSVINTNIDGNFIGTNPSGTGAHTNSTGVQVSGAAGTAIGDVVGNLIAGNGIGVSVGASSVPSTIRRNLIGITGLGNSGGGLEINASQTITEFNSFRSNVGDAVAVTGGVGNIIRDNIYESNGGIPIDLLAFTSFDGPTPNDDGTGDSDTGGNNIQNYPAIQSAFYDPQLDAVSVTFNFNSVSAASNAYIIALHKAEPAGTNPGSLQLVGSQCFPQKVFAPNTTSFFGTGLTIGDRVVMTATGYSDTVCPTLSAVADGTSEFSPPAVIALQPGVVTNTNDSGPGSLRQAILDANSGACPFTGCNVRFAIPTTDPGYSGGTWTIRPATEYPPITRGNLYFQGNTQASFVGGDPNPAGPEIVINGSLLASPSANGFQILASTAHVDTVEFNDLVINGFADNAIVFQGTSATAESRFHAVRRCYIGTNASGTAAVPNGTGIVFGPFSRNNQAGSGISIPVAVLKSSVASISTSGGNLISGNSGPGVLISHGSNNTVAGNRIGTNASGTGPLPNAVGVRIQGSLGSGNKVGGDPFWAENNIVAFNTGAGIEVNSDTTGHWFDRNTIHSNGALGIDLLPAGPTPNDPGDADAGANSLTNFPVITSVTYPATDTTVAGTMNGLPGATFEIQVFSSALPDPSGFGEGETYRGSTTITTDGTGNASWSVTFSGAHRWVSATATHQPSALPRVTSEFSAVFNTAPVGINDTYSTNEDVALTVPAPGVLGNDTDAEADPMTAILVTGPASGTLTLNSNGSFTYTPVANFNGPVTFTYMPNDGLANGNVTTVTINVIPVNDTPVASADAYAATEDVPLTQPAPGVLANDSDVEGPLTAVLTTGPANGTLTLNGDGSFTYTPNANFNGTDSFTYQASDGSAMSAPATVTISVAAVNDAPVAANDAYGTNQNTTLNVAAPGVLSNDSDPESAPLTAVLVSSTASGTLTFNANGSFTYTPNAGFTGTDSFTYRASDGSLNSNIASVTITVNNVNDPPVAANDFYATAEDTTLTVPAPGVLANDTDVDGDPLTALLVTGPARGTLSLAGNGSFIYQPFANLNGTDSFTYQASDGSLSATATVTITVTAVNDAPVAVDDNTSAAAGIPVTINVLSNDSDPDGDPLAVSLFSQGSQGTVSCTASGACTYTPGTTASGSDSFTYKVSDGNGGLDDGVVFITISVTCPTAPTPAFPTAGATNVPTSGTMSWEGSAGLFEVFFGPAGSGCLMSQGSLPGNSFRYSGLNSDTEYEWRIEASRSGCPNVSSQCVRFRTVKTCTTAAPTPISPVPGASVSSPITFSWTAVAGATNYKVFATSGSSETLLGQTTTTSLIASLPDSASSWYVLAENVPGCGNLRSASVTFRVCNAPERPLASVIGESTSGQTYTVTWEPVPNANRYEVLEANNAAFVDAISFTTEALFMTFTKDNVQQATPFFYQVRAFSDCFNGPGASSPAIRVVVVPVPPRETPNTSANAPVGSNRPIVIQVFVPGERGRTFRFTATGDQTWMTVRPESGELPESGITLDVTVDPRGLPNGTFTGTVIVTLIEPTTGRISLDSNHTKSTPVSINLVTPVTPVSSGPPRASSLIIPAVGHLDGSDARWRSDVRIANTSLNVSRYLLTFTPGNPAQGVKQTSLEIGPGATTALDDIVRAWYGVGSLGESSNGVLEVRPMTSGSNSTFKADPPSVSLATVVTSRTYAQTQSGTLGEFIPGVLFSNFVGLAASGQVQPILNLQQIAQNQAYRTNVGVVEASGNPVSVVLSIFNSAGNKLKDIPLGLKANEQRQLNSLLAENGIELADGRIEVRVTGGEGRVTAYAAVIDNRTKDQLFVPASTLGQFNSSRYVMPGIADLDTGSARWRSDMRIFNSGNTPQGATLTLHPQNNSSASLTASVTVEPGEVKVLDNIVRTLFGTSNMGGAVHVETPAESSLVVTARTYNQTTNGTLGLFIPAVTPQQAAGSGQSLNLVQAEDSVRYRTNVGIAEVTGNPVTVDMTIHLPDSKVTPRIEFPLAGNEFRQIGVLRELGIGNVYNARVSMRVIGGNGRITAYGSVIDMRTNDSTYVPAQ